MATSFIIILLIGIMFYIYYIRNEEAKEHEEINQSNIAEINKFKKTIKKKIDEIENLNINIINLKNDNQVTVEKWNTKFTKLLEANSEYVQKIENLKKYLPILDIEKEILRLKTIAEKEIKEANSKAREINNKINQKLQDANEIARTIEDDAIKKAKEIAGDAYVAKDNAEQYEATVKAMKNIINGYGDEYLQPNRNLLDNLADDYSHKEAGQELYKQRILIKSMIINHETADCDYVESYRKTTAIDFALDAYNGKVDTIMAKVKHDNYGKLLQQLEDAFRIVNHNGKAFKNARIISRYHNAIIKQLKLAVTTQELKRIDLEEQRKIKEQIREEEKARREYEKAIKEAEKEEKILQQAMTEAKKQLELANNEEKAVLEEKLKELQSRLSTAEEKGQRAMSMAQMTRTGHVYVISNIGSFGDNIFKIGMTRRLEPLDRVKELGDASVPFSFDVHAMIQAEDAPKLEKKLHKLFENNQVNKVNYRKEFFNVSLNEIKKVVQEEGYNLHWTMKAEALEFHETKQLELNN